MQCVALEDANLVLEALGEAERDLVLGPTVGGDASHGGRHVGEALLRVPKELLRVRPIWQQRADRVQARILVCFFAFVLWKTLKMWQRRSDLGDSVLNELARHTTSSRSPQRTARSACVASPTHRRHACSPARSPRNRPVQTHTR